MNTVSDSLRPQAVIFDCDGTLLNSMPAWHALEAHLAHLAGITLSEQQVDLLNANTLAQTVAYFHERYGVGEDYPQLHAACHAHLLEGYRTAVTPRPGAALLVRRLHADGVPLAVASSSPCTLLDAGLERMGIRGLFNLVASADDEGSSKRDPRFLAGVARRLGATPKQTWCVDDSAYALAVMHELGFRTIGIYDSDAAGTPAQLAAVADVVINDFDELDYRLLVPEPTPVGCWGAL